MRYKLSSALAFFLFIALSAKAQMPGQTADILIKNAKILDGTGNSWFNGDIAIGGGKIIQIGKLSSWNAKKIINATGLVAAPGFIDVHTHIEGDEVKNPEATNFIYDGVTTVITGNCGSSDANIGRYLRKIDSLQTSVNVAVLVGHNDVRKAVMGRASRNPTEAEMQAMEKIVDKAMRDGAVGMSTGLIYIPGTYSTTEEIVRLAKVAAKYNGVYASHMRDEGDSVVEAINEALYIGTAANMPVQISHFKLSGQQNWGRSSETLPLIINARKKGLDVTIDQYPYTASSTSLSTLIPDWVLADGQDSIVARLARPAIRKEVTQYMLARLAKRKLQHFSYPVVASYKSDSSFNGKSIEEVNLSLGKKHTATQEAETIIQMMEKGGASMVFHGMSELDIKAIMRYPFNMVASDASIRVYKEGNPHPRGYGTNARVLKKYVREENVISLEEAVRRMTSLPAQKFGFADRGLLRQNFAADIVLFNEAEVGDRAEYKNPHQYAVGFNYVIVNGTVTVDAGVHTGARAGVAIRK
jgi:N-acyl-D-amino-acid deacylase